MGLLNLLSDIVTTPIAIVKDIVTMGGELNDQDQTYTGKKIDKILEDIDDL